MATPAAVLNIVVAANTKGAIYGLGKVNTRLKTTDAHAAKTGASFKQLAKTAALTGGALGLGALAVGAKKAFGEFREAQKVTNQTSAVLKSTGRQAKVTAKEVENLANSISLYAGIDDEAVQSAENLLLTFTKVRNETGKGNKVFNDATKTIVDMSVALDQDLKSSAIQVGKALQDPEKGITALKRVGVNFTETQREMITGWLEHGKVLKAQKFILKELGTEFGGSAAAQSDSVDKLKVAWENMFEAFGNVIGPVIEKAAGALAKFLNQMQSGAGAGGRFADKLRSIGQVASNIVGFFRENQLALAALKVALIAGTAAWVGYRVAVSAAAIATTVATGGLNLIIPALAALAVALTLGYHKSAFLRKVMDEVAVSFQHFGKWVVNAGRNIARFGDGAADVAHAIGAFFSESFRKVKKTFGDVMAFIFHRFADLFRIAGKLPLVGNKFDGLAKDAQAFGDKIDRAGEKTNDLGSAIKNLPRKKQIELSVNLLFLGLSEGVKPPGPAFPPKKGDSGDPGIGAYIEAEARRRVGNMDPLGLLGGGAGIVAVGSLLQRMGYQVGEHPLFGGVGGRHVPGSYHYRGRAIDVNADGFPGGEARALDAIFPLLSRLPHAELLWRVEDHFDHLHYAMQRGGMIPGVGSGDKVPVLAEPGEGLINKRAVAALGGGRAIAAINSRVPRFAKGGMVRASKAGRAAGFKGSALQYLLAIGAAESGNYTDMTGDTSRGGSYGPWMVHHPSHPQYDIGRLMHDWTYSAKAAHAISGGGTNWNPWTMFRNGGYRAWMDDASRVMAAGGQSGMMEDSLKWNWATMGNKRRGLWTLGGAHLVVHAKRFANLFRRREINWGKSKHMLGDQTALKMFPGPLKKTHIPRDPVGIRDAFMQAFAGQIASRDALASLTAGTSDDIAVAIDAVRGWQAWLDLMLKKNDQSGITTSATELKSWQDRLADLNAPAVADSAVSDNQATRAGLLQTLLQQANQRTAVSQAQYGVLRNFGGSFAQGGVVPGPLGSPRVIVAHGGETVTPQGTGGVQVIVNGDIVNVPRGKKAIEVRDVRATNRSPLPGRGGGLQR